MEKLARQDIAMVTAQARKHYPYGVLKHAWLHDGIKP